MNKRKCSFNCREIDFLGHTISADGVHPSMEMVKAIVDMGPPRDVAELRRVVGMINYLGRYLPDLSNEV